MPPKIVLSYLPTPFCFIPLKSSLNFSPACKHASMNDLFIKSSFPAGDIFNGPLAE